MGFTRCTLSLIIWAPFFHFVWNPFLSGCRVKSASTSPLSFQFSRLLSPLPKKLDLHLWKKKRMFCFSSLYCAAFGKAASQGGLFSLYTLKCGTVIRDVQWTPQPLQSVGVPGNEQNSLLVPLCHPNTVCPYCAFSLFENTEPGEQ